MASKKTSSKKTRVRVDKQRGNNVKPTRGRPFEKGNRIGFKPGESGNPAGRPKVRTLSEELRARLQEQYRGKDGRTYSRLVAEALVDRAINGDVVAIREVFDRVEGKPRQPFNLVVEEKQRAIFNAGLAALKQTGMSDEEAAKYLAEFVPEANSWIN